MSNKHCRFLSNQYTLSTYELGRIRYRPCCHYNGETIFLDDRENYLKKKEYLHTAEQWIPECQTCKHMESAGSKAVAYRAWSFSRVPQDYDHDACVSLDISLDLECNAACIICGPHTSSLWAKLDKGKQQAMDHPAYEMTQINPLDQTEKFNKLFSIKLEPTDTAGSDLYLRQIIKYIPLDKLEMVLIKGGEPLLTNFHRKLLKHIVSVHPDPKKIIVRYNTNTSVFPDAEILELWKKFKEIRLNLSLDAIGERFNYIRWPLKWDEVEKNVERFINETDAKFIIQCTTNPLNVLYHNELQTWATKIIPDDRLISTELGRITNSRCYGKLDTANIPDTMKIKIVDLYEPEHNIIKLLKVFTETSVENVRSMIDFLDYQDNIRKTNWRKVFPETVDFFETFIA